MNHRRRLRSSTCLSAAALLCMLPQLALANPEGGVVSAGSASIATSGNTLTVNQTSNKAVIDWRGFDIGAGETTQFVQPGSTSIALNRVNSSSASRIDGNLTANGNVIIVNQNGVLFGQNAKVDVNGLVASTADIDTTKFMNSTGALAFDKAGNPNAIIANAGQITAKEAGLVGLVAPNVINNGVITAKLGRVHLASGDTATVDLYGDGLMDVAVSGAVQSQLVANSGVLSANGGTVALTAAAGKDIVNSLIAQSGALQAQSVGVKNGKIIIAAEGSNAVKGNITAEKGTKQGTSTVLVSGTLDASGRNSGERGGKVTVTGDNVALLNGTIIDASGHTGLSGTTHGKLLSDHREGSAGGDIRIGGDYLGQGDTATAKNLYVDAGVLVLNDALNSGDAGRTIFWSDDTTQFYGNVYARALGGKPVDALTWNATAGGNVGDGGFVETSGHHHLDAGGYVDLTASNGRRGTYFLDPTDITIYGNVDPAFVSSDSTINLASSLKLWLDASDTANVMLTYNDTTATASGTSGTNTITTSADVSSTLAVGARIRLGSAGAVTAANTLGPDTYTIASISGTTITLTSALTQNYTTSALHRGLVSQLTDKSGQSNNATNATQSQMPLWVSNGQNGLGLTQLDGGDYLNLANSISLTDYTASTVGNKSATNTDYTPLGGAASLTSLIYLGSCCSGQFFMAGTSGYSFSSTNPANTTTPAIFNWQLLSTNPSLNYNGFTYGFGSTVSGATNFNRIGGRGDGGYSTVGKINEIALYNTALSTNSRNLVDQYQSAKWGIALTPPGTSGAGTTEALRAMASTARAGDTVDGYSVFTTRYLERLSQSADISLQASNNINLDFKGDTLALATNRSLTLTADNSINNVSAGSIQTTGAGQLTLISDILNLTNFSLMSAGNVTLKPYTTSGTAINVATGSSGLQVTSNILSHITANSLTIGDAVDTGAVNIGAYNWGNSVSFLTGGAITVGGTQTTSGAYDFSAAGNTLNISDGISTNGGDINLAGIMSIAQTLDAGAGNITLTDDINNGPYGGIILNSGANLTGYDVTLHSFNTPSGYGAQVRLNSGSFINGTHSVTLQEDSTRNGNDASTGGYTGIVLNTGATVTTPTLITQTVNGPIDYNGATLNVSGTANFVNTSTGYININNALSNSHLTLQSNNGTIEINAPLSGSNNSIIGGDIYFNSSGGYPTYTFLTQNSPITGRSLNIASGITFDTQNHDFIFDGITTIAGTLNAGTGNITITDDINNGTSGGIVLNSGASLLGYDVTLHALNPPSTYGAQIRLNNGSFITGTHSVTLQEDSTRGVNDAFNGYTGIVLNSGATITAPTLTLQTINGPIDYNGSTINVSGNTLFHNTGSGFTNINHTLTNSHVTLQSDSGGININAPLTGSNNAIIGGNVFFNSSVDYPSYTFLTQNSTITGNSLNIGSGVTLDTQDHDFLFNGITTIAGTINAGTGNITITDDINNGTSGGIVLNSGASLLGYDVTLHALNPPSTYGAQIRLNNGSFITGTHSVTLQEDSTRGVNDAFNGYTGIVLNSGATITAPTLTLQTANGPIDYNGSTINVSGNTLIDGTYITINNALSTSNLILESDLVPTFNSGVTGTSSVTLRPHSAGNSIGVLTGTNAYQITSGILSNITTPNLIIGRTNGSGAMDIAANTWGENVQFITGSGLMSINGAQTMGAHNLTLQTDSNIAIGAAITSSGNVTIKPSDTTTTIGVAGGTGALNIGTADLNNITAASITIGSLSDSGAMDVGAYGWGSNLTLLDGSGGIGINGAQTLGNHSLLAQSSTRDITIGASGGVSSSATGTPITLVAGRNFINNAGSGALALSGGGSPRWLVYSSNPTSDTVSGQIAGGLANAFRRFSCTYGGSCPTLGSGNGLLYSYTPLLTITPSTLAAIYGNAVNLVGYAYNALTSGQYLSAGDFAVDTVSGSLTGSTTYSQGNNVGLYNINYSSGSLTSALGYGFTYANNATALNVGTRALSVTAAAKSKTYGTVTDPALTYTLTSGSFYGGDGFSGALSRVAGETVVGGPYAILQNTLTAGSNYNISYSGANLNITPYTLAVTAAAKSKTYGAADPSLTYTYGTLQNGDSSAVFSGSLSRVAGETVLGGPYAIGQNTLAAGSNYNISYTGANLNIAPATLTITGDAATRLQGQPNPSFTAHYSGFQYGDTAAVVSGLQLASIADGGSLAGEYAIVPSGATAANYTFAYINGVLTVTPFAATPNTVVRTSQDPINGLFSSGGSELSGGSAWGLANRVGADSGNTGNGEGGAYINGLSGSGNAHTSGESYASASAAIGSDRTINLRTDSSTRNAAANATPFIRWLDSMRGLLTIDPALAKRINLSQSQLNEL